MSVSLICDLLEIAFHHILFMKHVYPEPSFHRKQKYNIPTWKSKHPGVCSYIQNFILLAKKVLESRECLSAILTIKGEKSFVIEEFVFKVHLAKKEEESEIKWNMEDVLTNFFGFMSTNDVLPKEPIANNIRKPLGESFELKIMTNSKVLEVDGIKADLKNMVFPWNTTKKSKFHFWTRILPMKIADNEEYMMQIYRKSK